MKSKQTGTSVRVGILIPTYKRKDYLEQSLRSAIAQTYPDIEIIVIDNGTTDEIGRYVSGLNDPRITYIKNTTDLGLIGSIRKGMRLFSETVAWCTILPDDDLLDGYFIESMAAYVEKHQGIDVVHGHRVLIDAQGAKIGETSVPPEHETAVEYLVSRSQFIRQTFLAGVFFSCSAYDRISGYPEFATGMASDDALIFGLSLRQGLYFNPQARASVRMHLEAESHSSSNVFGHMQAFQDYQNYIVRMTSIDIGLPASDHARIRQALSNYIAHSISGLWIRRVQELLSGDIRSRDKELNDLYTLVRSKKYPFTLRVRAETLLAIVLRWNPEASAWYRRYWDDRQTRRVKKESRRS